MADINDDSLKRLLGDDPIATSVSVRIRQDEQTLSNLERRFNSIKKEAEGIVKALKEAGIHAQKLGGVTGGKGSKATSTIGSTTVLGGTITPTPIDRGQGTITGMNRQGQATTASGGGGGGGNIFNRMFQATQPGPDGAPTVGSTRMAAASDTLNTMLSAMDARIDRGYQYSLSADRVNMLFQQMKGMSQRAVQDTYRQPLSKLMLGQGGINSLLALEASTGMSAAQQAKSVEALRISSGFSVTAQQTASTLEQLASPQVANRMFMMTGMSIVKPGGGFNTLDDLMKNIVKTQGLTDPRLLQGAKAPGSVTRANLSMIGITGELQNQVLQYAEQNLAYKQKGGTGMYDPRNKEHQKIMGIDQNFALQKERTDQLRVEREEQFYSRQADNFADLERQTQSLVRTLAALEDKLSGIFGTRISTRVGASIASRIGNAILPGGLGNFLGGALGTITGIFSKGDAPGMGFQSGKGGTVGRTSSASTSSSSRTYQTADMAERRALSAGGTSSPSKTPASGMSARAIAFNMSDTGPRPKSFSTADQAARALATSAAGGALGRTGAPGVAGAPLAGGQPGQLTPYEVRLRNTPIVGPDGKLTNLYDLYKNPRVQGQFPGFTANWMSLYADYYAATNDVGRLTSANRTMLEQEQMWLKTMRPTGLGKGQMPADSRGDWFYQGQYWVKNNPSDPDVAWPGAPWANHQHGLAIDLQVGNADAWSDFNRKNASSYGLEWFGDVNDEPWHLQMAGTRVRGEGGGAGYIERQGFGVPDISANDPASFLQDRRKAVNFYNSNRDLFLNGNTLMNNLAGGTRANQMNSTSLGLGKQSGMYTDMGVLGSMLNQLSAGGQSPAKQLSSGAYINGKPLNPEELMTYIYNAGFRGNDLVQAYAIMMRESAGVTSAKNPNNELSYGLFQINMDPGGTNPVGNRKAWGISSNEELFDPATNARIAFEKYKWNIGHGRDPFHDWGPYRGMPALGGGAAGHLPGAIGVAQKLGYISAYTGPMGDGLYPEEKPAYRPELKALPSLPQVGGSVESGNFGMVPGMVGGNTITIAPTINISASGGNLDQDFERMARKVAALLEQEVNRTMMRRT